MSSQLDPVRARELLRRQDDLQAEAAGVITDLDLLRVLGRAGAVRLIGSAATGLMVWRDLDVQVLSPGLSAAEAWDAVRPVAAHPRAYEVRFIDQSGPTASRATRGTAGTTFRSTTARTPATSGSSTSPSGSPATRARTR